MEERSQAIRYIPGSSEILVVAPHAPIIDGKYENDKRTGIIAEEIQRQLGCYAIINDRYFKPKGEIKRSTENYILDLFRIDHSSKIPEYLDRIREVVSQEGPTLLVWMHGIADDVALAQGQEHVNLGFFNKDPEKLCALIGYGQGGDPKTGEPQAQPSAMQETIETFCHELTSRYMIALPTHQQASNFRGRDVKRLNQWFNQLGYPFSKVESFQLEIKEYGFRDSRPNAIQTGKLIASALDSTIKKP